jgi:hypothetical protein
MARYEASSEGGCASYNQILEATAIEDQLASDNVKLTIFLAVGISIELLGVIVESISSGEMASRHWTGGYGAVVVVAAEECPNKADLA